jgi:Ser/Thr protein kinase RdoA (MazF antagonist)
MPTTPSPALGYADLTPQQVLAALDAVSLRGDGRILQLNSYENRVFQVMLEDGRAVVAKFYRPGRWSDAQIVEEHDFALELAAAEVPVVPPLLLEAEADPRTADGVALRLLPEAGPHTLACLHTPEADYRYAVSTRYAGRAPELDDADTLVRLGSFIGRLHAVGAGRAFTHRRVLDPVRDGRWALDLLLAGRFVPEDQEARWRGRCEAALDRVEAAFERFGPLRLLRLHGDCHPGNVLWRDEGGQSGAHVVDLDDAFMGPAVQDLWMLVSGEGDAAAQQMRLLLRGYRQFMRFDERELALIEPLRTLRMVRHSAWLAERWSDPAFPRAFPFFDSSAYWAEQAVQLQEQFEAMSV